MNKRLPIIGNCLRGVNIMNAVQATKSHTRKSRSRTIVSTSVAFFAALGLCLASSTPAAAAQSVYVYLTCNADGSFAWSANGYGYTPNRGFAYYEMTSVKYHSGGYFGDYDWDYLGTLQSNAGGQISTPTFSTLADNNREYVTVEVKIGSASGSKTDWC